MARARLKKLPVPMICASPAMIASLCDLLPADIQRAVALGDIPVHCIGVRRRILLTDATAWIKSLPSTMKRRTPDGV
jgi:hypothetical protein